MKRQNLAQMMTLMAMYGAFVNENPSITRTSTLDISPKVKPIPSGCQRFKFESDKGEFTTDALTEKRAIKKFNKWYKNQ